MKKKWMVDVVELMVNATMVQGYFATSLFDTGPEVLEKIFKVNVFSLFCYYLPLGKGMALHLSKLESSLPKDAKFD